MSRIGTGSPDQRAQQANQGTKSAIEGLFAIKRVLNPMHCGAPSVLASSSGPGAPTPPRGCPARTIVAVCSDAARQFLNAHTHLLQTRLDASRGTKYQLSMAVWNTVELFFFLGMFNVLKIDPFNEKGLQNCQSGVPILLNVFGAATRAESTL